MSQDLSDLRQEYIAGGLHEADVSPDPVKQFDLWFQEALMMNIDLANAMVLATADGDGKPSARFVLMKEYSHDGIVFYSNRLSQKGREIEERAQAALVFYWKELHRQVRIEGQVVLLPAGIADEYFESRPRGSQISAWVATQSEVIPDQKFMHDKFDELNGTFEGRTVPRPEAWLGYRIIPGLFEFWQGQENRLHDRILYLADKAGSWSISRLAP
jgi:pyridoxamine 5'-phosphate oxidase